MSARNLFVLKFNKPGDIKRIYSDLNSYMESKEFSVVFEPKGYWDEMLTCLDCESNYFTVTESKRHIECEDIFSTADSFEFARRFPRRDFRNKEHEFLQHKLSFFNDIIQIVFKDVNIQVVELYISDQYSTDCDVFHYCVPVADGNLTEALIATYKSTKKNKYFGMKTAKFIIERWCSN